MSNTLSSDIVKTTTDTSIKTFNLVKVPCYVFVGDSLADHIAIFLKGMQKKQQAVSTLYLDVEHADIMKLIIRSVDKFGKDFGIDFGERLPQPDHIYFVDKANLQILKKYFKVSPQASGFSDIYTNNIFFLKSEEKDKDVFTYIGIVHELIHLCSYREVKLGYRNKKTTYKITRTGYWQGQDNYLLGLNESVTELTSQQIIKNYWSSKSRLYHFKREGQAYSYYFYLMTFATLLLDISKRKNTPVAKIFRNLQTGYFMGGNQPEYIEDIKTCYDKTSINKFLNYDPDLFDYQDMINISTKLGLPDMSQIAKSPKDGNGFSYMNEFIKML